MASCKGWDRKLSLWATGSLDEEEIRALEEHLAGCESCREEEEGYADLVQILRERPMADPGDSFFHALQGSIQRELASRPKGLMERLRESWAVGWQRAAAMGVAAAVVLLALTLVPARAPRNVEFVTLDGELGAPTLTDLDDAELGALLSSLDRAIGQKLDLDLLPQEETLNLGEELEGMTEEELEILGESLSLQEL